MSFSPPLFECNGCGECCRNYRIPLTLSDLLRLLRANPDGAHWVELNAEAPTSQVQVLFLEGAYQQLRLRYDRAQQACQFLDDANQCTIHFIRPNACRVYPLKSHEQKLYVMEKAQKTYQEFCDKTVMAPAAQKQYLADTQRGQREAVLHNLLASHWNEIMLDTPTEATLTNLVTFTKTKLLVFDAKLDQILRAQDPEQTDDNGFLTLI